jgi:hypothetical protein
MYIQRNIEARSCNHCCRGKAVSITYCECVSVALVILLAMRMRRTILSSVACPARSYFSTCSQNGTIVEEKLLVKCVWFSLQILS